MPTTATPTETPKRTRHPRDFSAPLRERLTVVDDQLANIDEAESNEIEHAKEQYAAAIEKITARFAARNVALKEQRAKLAKALAALA